MSADKTTAPSTGYTLHIGLNDARSYNCDFCSESSPDIDAARAHRNVHVLGPDLLKAAKELLTTRGAMRETTNRQQLAAIILKTRAAGDALAAVVAKAEPPKGQPTP